MQDAIGLEFIPKYNMPRGLDQLKLLSVDSQTKFYRMYLSQMTDVSIHTLILKKILYRMGSLGAIPDIILQQTLTNIEFFENQCLPLREEFRTVDFKPYNTVLLTVLQRMVNLLGVQGDNCQATYHHRFIMSSKNPLMLSILALDVLDILKNKPSLSSEVIKQHIEKFKTELIQDLV